jgi:hypothetical protein
MDAEIIVIIVNCHFRISKLVVFRDFSDRSPSCFSYSSSDAEAKRRLLMLLVDSDCGTLALHNGNNLRSF